MSGVTSPEGVVGLIEQLGVGVVAGYWPVGSEMDTRTLLETLIKRGLSCVLPVVADRSGLLEFRTWEPEQELLPDKCSIPAPRAQARLLRPDLVLVPLLAFDRSGLRLGQGLGLYDRTLAALRNSGTVVTVGLGYSFQEVEELPRCEHDQPMDWIATENQLIATTPGAPRIQHHVLDNPAVRAGMPDPSL